MRVGEVSHPVSLAYDTTRMNEIFRIGNARPLELRSQTERALARVSLDYPGEELSITDLRDAGVKQLPLVTSTLTKFNNTADKQQLGRPWDVIREENSRSKQHRLRAVILNAAIGDKMLELVDAAVTGLENPKSLLEREATAFTKTIEESNPKMSRVLSLSRWDPVEAIILNAIIQQSRQGLTVQELKLMLSEQYSGLSKISEEQVVKHMLGVVRAVNDNKDELAARISMVFGGSQDTAVVRFFWQRNRAY